MILEEMANLPKSQLAKKSTQTQNDLKALVDVFCKLAFWTLRISPSFSCTIINNLSSPIWYHPDLLLRQARWWGGGGGWQGIILMVEQFKRLHFEVGIHKVF